MPSAFSEPRRRVAVTAIGVVSPLGLGLSETLESLRAGRDGVTPVTRFDVSRHTVRDALRRLRDEGTISDEVLFALERELDLEEARLEV